MFYRVDINGLSFRHLKVQRLETSEIKQRNLSRISREWENNEENSILEINWRTCFKEEKMSTNSNTSVRSSKMRTTN